jgi:hypothetical protein
MAKYFLLLIACSTYFLFLGFFCNIVLVLILKLCA